MFCGIIEAEGKVTGIKKEKDNLHFSIKAPFLKQLKIDQSIAHNGVCLTVTDIKKDHYVVTAIKETLLRSNIGKLKVGDPINLERCMKLGDRIDGHLVQGHVDCTAVCTSVKEQKGSHLFTFECKNNPEGVSSQAKLLVVEKGCVAVNGASLTVVASEKGKFSVAIIPYTFGHTNFGTLKKGDLVNIEFDIIGKYVVNTLH